MTSVAFVSPAHGRFAVTALVLAQRQRLICELARRGIDAASIIVASDENLEIARAHGAEAIEAPNLPLGRKCNIGLQAAAAQADHVVWIGSDDWIHPDAFKLIQPGREQKPRIITGRRMAVVDIDRGKLQRITSPSKYGAVPWLIDSRLLRTRRTDFVRPDLNRGLDGGLVRGLRRVGARFEFVFHDPNEFRCVDFKTDENITPYRGLALNLGTGPEEPAWATLERFFPADLVDLARATAAEQRPKGRRVIKLTNAHTGLTATVSAAGATVLRGRGWNTTQPGARWPKTHARLNALARELSVSFPPPAARRLSIPEKIAALEAAGHTPRQAA